MSSFSQFVGVGPKTIQTAYVDYANGTETTGTGEDAIYWDITVATTLTDYTKAEVYFEGGISYNADTAKNAFVASDASSNTSKVSARMTSVTNLRLSTPSTGTAYHLTGRYYIKEWW